MASHGMAANVQTTMGRSDAAQQRCQEQHLVQVMDADAGLTVHPGAIGAAQQWQ